MPSWGELLGSIQLAEQTQGPVNFDQRRLEALKTISDVTDRPVVSYYAAFLSANGPQAAAATAINLGDIQGLMEVFRGLSGTGLDVILHSPGGQAEATDSLVRYMRSKYSNIRVFVPLAAMSAATMWAMAADEIFMGKHSQLGPIDPQVTLPAGIQVPAGALLEQFETALDECSHDPGRVAGWLPTLQQYPPGLLNLCKSASELSKALVEEWLRSYMFADDPTEAAGVAAWLADDKIHLSHGRALRREDLLEHGLKVTELEKDEALQDAVLTYHHLAMLTFQATSAFKIIENNIGSRFISQGQVIQPVIQPQGFPMPFPVPISPVPAQANILP